MQQFSEFILTDGTTKIDFLALNHQAKGGIGIDSYVPGRSQPKNGGVWQDSTLAPGRRLVYQTFANVVDTLNIKIAHRSPESLVVAQEELDILLNKALAYWTVEWQDEPVYIQTQAHGETSRRYALVYGVTMGEYQDPYNEPMAGPGPARVAANLTLGIERSPWLGNPPGTDTDILISHEKHAATNAVFIGNGRTTGLTEVRSFTSTGGAAYSSNLLLGSLPYSMYSSAGIAAEDTTTAIYFGSPYPFTSVVFSISTPAQNIGIVWEISDGVGGYLDVTTSGAQYLRDDTNEFSAAGLNIVQWFDDANFYPQALSSFGTMYWIRARFTGSTDSPFSGPTIATVHPYTTKYPYVEIAATQVPGNLDALANIRISTKSRTNNTIILPQNILIGLRSIYRSGLYCGDFSAYINMRSADNPSGISIDLTGATTHTTVATLTTQQGDSPTGYAVTYSGSTGDVLDEVFRVNFDTSIIRQYYGRYRLFVKFFAFDFSGSVQVRARAKFENADNEFVGVPVVLADADFLVGFSYLADLGYIRLPPSNMVSFDDQSVTVSLIIDGMCGDGQSIKFYELILMPVDEWSAVATGTTTSDTGDFVMDIDSVHYPKESARALLRDPVTDRVLDSFPLISNQDVGIHARTQQRLWFLQKNNDAHYGMSALVSVSVNPRYYNLRRV